MKILMVSMFSLHFFRWAEQLKDSGHEVYWIDVFDSNTPVKEIDFIHQIVGWKRNVNYPGRYWIKNKLPGINKIFSYVNEKKLSSFVDQKIKEINPDVVHSFILQSATIPILEVMKNYPKIKWVYSAWGNDLYFRQQNKKDLVDIKKTLPALDYMFADCRRDFYIAQKYGFAGNFLGVYPTGGGYDLTSYQPLIKPPEEKKTILIKGYEGKLGRCIRVLEAILPLKTFLFAYNIKIFGGSNEVEKFVQDSDLKEWSNLKLYKNLPHIEVLNLMGESLIYIGNSISDGMPNTLLEAIIMQVYPIQSNPGGATEELISNGKNGFLINDVENSEEIKNLLVKAIRQKTTVREAINYNNCHLRPFLEREYIKKQVLAQYRYIAEDL